MMHAAAVTRLRCKVRRRPSADRSARMAGAPQYHGPTCQPTSPRAEPQSTAAFCNPANSRYSACAIMDAENPVHFDRMASTTRSETAFTHEQFAEAYPEGIENHFWYVARNGFVSDAIRWIDRRQQRSIGKMLEIGCGRGIVVDHLRRSGRDCYGAELSPVRVLDAVKDQVWSGTDCLDLPEQFRREVELILLLDVIEHIEDPVRFLAGIRHAYPNCRWLITSIPAPMELWSNFDEAKSHF